MDSSCKSPDATALDDTKRIFGCNRVFVLLMSGPHLAWATLDIMKVAGAEPIKNKASQWAMDIIDFAAPAADPLDHECNRIKCSLR